MFTGYGAVAEALGFVLLAVGAAFSGRELLAGIVELAKFFAAADDARSEDDLKSCGRLFGDAVAKIGVDGLFFVMSMFGLKKASARLTTKTVADSSLNARKWKGKRIEERELKIGKVGKTKPVDLNLNPKASLRFNETRCHDHLIYGDGIKPGQTGVSGAHNKSYFQKTITEKFEPVFKNEGLDFNINDCIESTRSHPGVPGVEEIKYKLPAMNQNNTINKGVYKKIKMPKTVYDSSVISDEQMLQWGKEALRKAIENNEIINGRIVEGVSDNGLKFRGFLDNKGEITNFFPLIDN